MAGKPALQDHPTIEAGRSLRRRDVITLAPPSLLAVGAGAFGFLQEPVAAARPDDAASPRNISDGTALTAARKAYYDRARF